MKKFAYKLVAGILTAAPIMVLAQGSGGGTGQLPPYNPRNITDLNSFKTVFQSVANWIGYFVLAVAVVIILLSAFNFMTAGGADEKITTARRQLIYALVGIAVALLAFSLPAIVSNLLQ